MKKAKIISVVILGLLAIGLVSAGLVSYFGQKTTTIDVELPIKVLGETNNEMEGMGCEEVKGEIITIVNEASVEIPVQISTNEVEGVDTTYIGTLKLSKKVVDFGNEPWEKVAGSENKATVEYTVKGDSFNAEVISGELEGYVLVYYKDNSDRFNSPAEAILVADVSGNLPYANDKNADEYNYCTIEEYDTCFGAKLWYVPEDAITDSELDWNRADEFLFETNLIQYNNLGVITMYPGADLEIYPLFDLDCLLNGTIEITTTVDLYE